MKCIILAGGFGTRLKTLVPDTPKPLINIRGKPIINHILEKIPNSIEIIISTNRKFEGQFVEWKKNLIPQRQVELSIEEVHTEAEKPGAVSALNMVVKEKKIDEDMLVIAGDNYFEFDLHHFINSYDGHNTLIAVFDVGDLEKVKDFAEVTLGPRRNVIKCIEKPKEPATSLVSIACYVFPFHVLSILNDYCSGALRDNLGSFIAHLVNVDYVYAYQFKEKWYDIGSVTSFLEATSES
jgi:glucose-1-phosphate thymidylyltransferase